MSDTNDDKDVAADGTGIVAGDLQCSLEHGQHAGRSVLQEVHLTLVELLPGIKGLLLLQVLEGRRRKNEGVQANVVASGASNTW